MKNHSRQIFLLFLSAVLFTLPILPNPIRAQATLPAFFQIEAANEQYIDLVASAPSYEITQETRADGSYDRVTVPGANASKTPGSVELPLLSTLVGVPPQAQITLEILEDQPQPLARSYQLALAPFPAALTEDGDLRAQWDYTLAPSIRVSHQLNSAAHPVVRIADEAWLRDQRLVRLEYSPFEYNAANGHLSWHPSVKIRLHFEYPGGNTPTLDSAAQSAGSNPALEALLRESLLNYDQAAPWRALPETYPRVIPPESGARYRIAITEDAIYKLTYEALYAANPAIAGVESSLLHMTSQGDEIAIQVEDADGSFGPGDYVLFYGQRFYGDRLADLYQGENMFWANLVQQQTDGTFVIWKPQFNAIMLEKYTHENVYWLAVGSDPGLRMATISGDPAGVSESPLPSYRERVRAEKSNEWKTTLFTGEDTWFWALINRANTNFFFSTELTAIAPAGPDVVVRGEFVSESYNLSAGYDHHTQVSLNGSLVDEAYWSGKSRYYFETITNTIGLLEGTNTLSLVARDDAQVAAPRIFFDWFEIEYNRLFQATGNQIHFSNAASGLQKYQVDQFSDTSGLSVLDVSNPLAPVRVLDPAVTVSEVTIALDNLAPLAVVMDGNPQAVPQAQIAYYTPPDWSALATGADYIYITHADLRAATEALASYRAAQSGLSTRVIDVQDLYNEFNFGIFHPIAIKNFLAYAFASWQTIPSYALLVGDGHWNFHEYNPTKYVPVGQYLPPNLVWVDPWQGEVDSANLLANVVGEDILADLFIARLPVNSSSEIEAYQAKLMGYEAPHSPEAWERNHLFIADNADDAGNFPINANDIIYQFVAPAPFADEIRIYQNDYSCTSYTGTPDECKDVRDAITNTINTGTLIVNYIGHASVQRWSHEYIFTPTQFPNLTNSGRLPVILSMDCLDGYWSGPANSPGTSMIEELVRMSNTGAIAAFSPTGLGVSTGHDILHRGFYTSLMNEGNWNLGAAAMKGKISLYTLGAYQDLVHTYTTFGDPALQIRNPFGFSAAPARSSLSTLEPGSTLTHSLTIHNTGTTADTYEIQVQSNWQVSLPFNSTPSVAAGASLVVPIQITTPEESNVLDVARVTITSRGNRANTFSAELTSRVLDTYQYIYLPFVTR